MADASKQNLAAIGGWFERLNLWPVVQLHQFVEQLESCPELRALHEMAAAEEGRDASP